MSVTMLYRKREEVNAEAFNLPLDTIIVADEDVEGAMGEGWLDAASAIASLKDTAPGPFASILDGTVAEVKTLLDQMTADELADMHAAEMNGKTRDGLIYAINKAIAAKTQD